jgi:serine/threonine protein kinase
VKETYLRDMLQKEIDVSSQLDHANLARLYRVLQDGTRVFIVQEYCGTQTLSQFAEQKKISENKAKHIFRQVVSAVNHMHLLGFAHRDLKFSNILLNDSGVIKLVDFGFACDANRRQRIFCGTPSYMPPELIKKKEYVPFMVDLWSMGVILFKLLTGNYPFGACNDKDLEHRIEGQKYKHTATLKVEHQRLVENLLCYAPADRMNTDSILNYAWIKH